MRPPRRRRLLTVIPSAALTAAAAMAALSALPRPAHAAPGDPDLTFGDAGRLQSPGGANGVLGLAVQPDGKILIAGAETSGISSSMTMWRFHPDGSRDLSFNGGTGRTALTSPPRTAGQAVFVHSDGRLLLVGRDPNSTFLACFLPDGRPDLSFGPARDGLVSILNFGPVLSTALQPDGKIVMANGGGSPYKVKRLLPDGSPDPAFGTGGSIDTPPSPLHPGGILALAVQSDGKILLGREDSYYSVTRLHPNGTLDTAFGVGGGGTAHLAAQGVHAKCRALVALPDGRILAGGSAPDSSGAPDSNLLLARFLPDGTLDTTFGHAVSPGRARYSVDPVNFVLTGMIVQSDGRILTSGTAGSAADDLFLLRCTADGLPDPAFGDAGRVRTPAAGTFAPRATALLPDEKLLIGGIVSGESGTDHLLLRYQAHLPLQLTVEHPHGTALPANPPVPVDFGPVTAGAGFITLTLRNNGLDTLTGLHAAVTDASLPGEYYANPPAATTLAPGAVTTVVLSFTPSAAPGLRTATLRLTAGNTNPALPPRLVPLTGSKATPLEIWRVTWFGSPHDAGPGADANDFDGDGLPNFMEYATRTHPHLYSTGPCQPAGPGTFTYTRPAAALTEFSYTPESAPTPNGPWSSAGLTGTVLTDDGTVQTVQVAAPAGPPREFLRLRVRKL